MASKKRLAATIGAMALTAVIAVGGTLAYLSSVTETKKNTFTSGKNIETELTETEWNEDSGKDYTPGKIIAKNPVMENKGNEDIWTAVRIDFVGSDGKMMSKADFAKYASTDVFNSKWEQIGTNADGSELWIYKSVVNAGSNTDAIFTKVTVNAGIAQEWTQASKGTKIYKVVNGNRELVNTGTEKYDPTIAYYNENNEKISKPGELPQFEIAVTGFAVQAAELTAEDGTITATGRTELVNLANSKSSKPFTVSE